VLVLVESFRVRILVHIHILWDSSLAFRLEESLLLALGAASVRLLGFSLEPLLGFSLADESVYSQECGWVTL
jgi:hypothetical protein